MIDSNPDQEPLPLTSGCWLSLAALTAISTFIQAVFDPFDLDFSPWVVIVSGGLVLVLLLSATRSGSSGKPVDDSGSEGNQPPIKQ
jgi:hypothetical protein